DAWAVGSYIAHGGYSYPLVEHWNGTKWSAMTTPELAVTGWFNAVVANSGTDVWGLGQQTVYGPADSTIEPLIEHWDGVSWTIVSSPSLPSGGNLFHAASTPSGLWGVGFQYWDQTLAERWDGSHWSVVTTPSLTYSFFKGVDALS